MTTHLSKKSGSFGLSETTRIILTLAALLWAALPAAAQNTFECDNSPILVQNEEAQLKVPVSLTPAGALLWGNVGAPISFAAGTEINNLGFRSTDGLLYAVELNPFGNNGVIQIDNTGATVSLGFPKGLPTDVRFDAGDVSPDGSTLYVNQAGLSPLYAVDLDTMTTTSVKISGGFGNVHDWAAHPTNGLLYGGDSSHGQLAVLDPVTGVRTDFWVTGMPGVPELPKGVGYGAAWFDGEGLLALARNDGSIFVIDPAVPQIVAVEEVPASARNDGAACQSTAQERSTEFSFLFRWRCFLLRLRCNFLGGSFSPGISSCSCVVRC